MRSYRAWWGGMKMEERAERERRREGEKVTERGEG
jgi:hypothetical protein